MNITVVVDDLCPKSNLKGEHGLSLFIETSRGKLLLDTGAGWAIRHNLDELGISHDDIDHIVLSHGHGDHTGGLKEILQKKGSIPVWASPYFNKIRYSLKGVRQRYNGNLYPVQAMDLHPLDGGEEIIENVFAIRVPIERRKETFIPVTNELVSLQFGKNCENDLFEDDISLLVNGRYGYSVILGCAHTGVVNILTEIREFFGVDSFYSVIGGMHLKSQTEEFLHRTCKALSSNFTVERWFPNHCTGINALIAFSDYFNNVQWASSGTKIEI